MIIKKFIGRTELEAVQSAKAELGENIVIMNVRKVKAKGLFASLRSKKVEVTAAVEEDVPMDNLRKLARAQDRKMQEAKKKDSESREDKGTKSGLGPSAEMAKPVSLSAQTTEVSQNDKPSVSKESAGSTKGKDNTGSQMSPSTIEQKLDSLQNLLESQFKQTSVQNEKPAANAGSEDAGSNMTPGSDPDNEKEREMDRFLKLLYNTMLDNEIEEKLANEIIIEANKNRKPNATMDFILSAIYQRMILKFGKSDGITPATKGPKAIFFLGPTGVGKTTTIAKVASSFSVNEKKKVAFLTTDTYRIAATDQLRTYAGILGVPFRVIYTEDELAAAIEDFSDCDYIFIDTAGHSHKNSDLLVKQKKFIDSIKDVAEYQCFLVMSATTKNKDLRVIVDNYREMSDHQLIFTKLDETSSLGNLYNMRAYSGAPIAYVTAGQNVPDDIESFNAQKIVKLLLGGNGD